MRSMGAEVRGFAITKGGDVGGGAGGAVEGVET